MTKSYPPPLTSKSAELSREEQARALCLRLLTARARTRAELAGQQGSPVTSPGNIAVTLPDLSEVAWHGQEEGQAEAGSRGRPGFEDRLSPERPV